MSIIRRSKTKLEEPSYLVTSPRDVVMNRPKKIFRARQGQVIVTRAAREGSPLTLDLVANGTQQSASFTVSKCMSKKCLTCPKFIVNKTFYIKCNCY